MISRLRGAIAYSPDTKLPGEDVEDIATDWGARPSLEVNPSGKISEILRLTIGGIYPTPRRISLGSKSRVGTITDLENGEKLDLSSYLPRQS